MSGKKAGEDSAGLLDEGLLGVGELDVRVGVGDVEALEFVVVAVLGGAELPASP